MIGEFRRLMRAKGWTQQDAARRLGISQGHLSKLLRGDSEPRPLLLLKFDRLLASRVGRASARDVAESVQRAASASPEFAALIQAALALVEKE